MEVRDMSAPPLSRDQQIQVMKGARDRRAATLARWSQDPEIHRLFVQPVTRTEAHSLEKADEYIEQRRA
jgi:hypothetical protein